MGLSHYLVAFFTNYRPLLPARTRWFHYAKIHARGYGSSTDLEVKDSSGRLRVAAAWQPLKSRSVFSFMPLETMWAEAEVS